MTGLDIAKTKLGLQEVKDRAKLIEFFKAANINLDPQTTPWCAAFVNACEVAAGKVGTKKVNARSFLTYGVAVKREDAKEGDIVILSRGHSAWQGHVAYFVSIDDKNSLVTLLGGNQADKVCMSKYDTAKILGIRRSA